MFVHGEVLKHMDKDELIELVQDMAEVSETISSTLFATDRIVDLSQHLYNEERYRHDLLTRMNKKQDRLKMMTDRLNKKYGKYIPVPVCSEPAEKEPLWEEI